MPRIHIPHPDVVINRLLGENHIVRIVVDATRGGVVVPLDMRSDRKLILDIGLNLPTSIPDLHIDRELGIEATLSFGGRSTFCIFPWSAILGMIGLTTSECVLLETLPGLPVQDTERPPAPTTRSGNVIDMWSHRTAADRDIIRRRFARAGNSHLLGPLPPPPRRPQGAA